MVVVELMVVPDSGTKASLQDRNKHIVQELNCCILYHDTMIDALIDSLKLIEKEYFLLFTRLND